MTQPQPLSPAAQAVVDAWDAKLNPDPDGLTCLTHDPEREALAAGLRALAARGEAVEIRTGEGMAEFDDVIRTSDILAIAAELEALND